MNPALTHPSLSAGARLHYADGASLAARGIWSRRPSETGDVEAPTSLTFHTPMPEADEPVVAVSDPATSTLYTVLSHDESKTAMGSRVEWRSSLYHLRDEGRVYAPETALYTAPVTDPHVTAADFLTGASRSFLASPVRWARYANPRFAALAYPRALGRLTVVRVPGEPLNQAAVFQTEDDVELYGIVCRTYATRWEVFESALGGGRAELEMQP